MKVMMPVRQCKEALGLLGILGVLDVVMNMAHLVLCCIRHQAGMP